MKRINRSLQHSVGVAAKGIGTAVEYRREDLLLAHRMRQDQRMQLPPGPAGGVGSTALLNLLQSLEGGGGDLLIPGALEPSWRSLTQQLDEVRDPANHHHPVGSNPRKPPPQNEVRRAGRPGPRHTAPERREQELVNRGRG